MPPKQKEDDRVDITTLTPRELVDLRERMEADFDRLAESQAVLNRLVSRLNASSHAIETLAASKEGKAQLMHAVQTL